MNRNCLLSRVTGYLSRVIVITSVIHKSMKNPPKARRARAVKNKKTDKKKRHGFTIIEVLIVLAIAGLILATLMFIIPTLNRNGHNDTRKRTVNLVAAQMDVYRNDHNGKYPMTGAEMCTFVTDYMKETMGSGVVCNPSFDPSGECVRVVSDKIFSICFHHYNNSGHEYIGPVDEISVQTGHWCNDTPAADGEPVGNPIAGGGGHPAKYFVVWTTLEPAVTYCVDNYEK